MEQIEISIKTEVEAAATSPAHCDSEIGVNFFKQEPGLLQSVKSEPSCTNDALLKEESLVDSSRDGSGQQCVHDASTPASAGGMNETCNTSLSDLLNVKYESAEMDIGQTVLQNMDSHYTVRKNTSAAVEENRVVVDCNKAMPGGGVKDSFKDGSEQQCTYNASTSARTGGVDETCSTSLGDLFNVKYESAEMDIGPTVLQHMDSHYTFNENMCADAEKNKIVVACNEAMPGGGVKKENIEGEGRDDKATSHNCDRTTAEVYFDQANVNSHPGQQKDLQKYLLHQHRVCENGLNLHKRSHSSVELKDHLANYESETRRKHYNCDSGAKFAQRGDLTKNIGVQKGEKLYKCKICDARFVKCSHLTTHVRVHTGEKPYQCKVCNARFTQSGNLTKHIRVHTGEKPYQCMLCDASFATNDNLTQHVKVHTDERPYQCNLCDARFISNCYLTRHTIGHTGEKHYQCKICDAKFATNGHLTQHVKVHTGEKPYQCKVCDASFAQSGNLNQHVKVHTGEKRYLCKICDARFARNSSLEQHVRRHTGVKPYQCKICVASFAQKSTLYAHMRLHTGEKPYKCKICDESFARYHYLNRHMRVHVGEKHC